MSVFRYLPGTTCLHSFDPRLKLPLIAVFSIAAFSSSVPASILLAVLTAALFFAAKIPALFFFSELRRFVYLFLVIAAAAFLSSADGTTGFLSSVPERTLHSLLACFRFVLVIAAGTLLTATTRLPDLRHAIEYFLRPVPFIDEKKTALMMELTISFFPLLFVKMDEIDEAAASRSAGGMRGTRRLIKHKVLPLFAVTFKLADEITYALESRSYSENRSTRHYNPALREKAAAAGLFLLLVCAAVFTG